jgi:hypothetical protein
MLQAVFDFADYIAYRTHNFLNRELVVYNFNLPVKSLRQEVNDSCHR